VATKKLSKNERNILDKLRELGGEQIDEEALRFEGSEFIIPEAMSAKQAVRFLESHIGSENEEHAFQRSFNYRPWDGAHALQGALRKLTGVGGIGQKTHSFFGGEEPPEMRTINVGPNKQEQVPWGQMHIPLINGMLTTGGTGHPDFGMIFVVSVTAPKKYKAHIEGLFTLIEEELRTNSIYRGQAIDGQTMPEFLDLSGVDPEKVIFTEEVQTQLKANVWSLLDHDDKMRELGMPLKRAVLLEGPYGTGKTLAGYLTAQAAVRNGWTMIYCRPKKDDLGEVMGMARLYQPSVVFFEDVDSIASPTGQTDGVTQLLDTFDGINAKGTEILCVLTTNHKERIHKGMVRPGRLDAVIEIGALDGDGIKRMVLSSVPTELLGDLDYDVIEGVMEGFLPAFVKEAIDRATRYNVARNDGEATVLETADFTAAASGLRPQLALMEGASETKDTPTLDAGMRELFWKALGGTELFSVFDEEVSHRVLEKTNGNE
jgi:transitional endoplasmic reticulum ATPase